MTCKKLTEENSRFRIFLKNTADPDEFDRHFRDLHNEIFIRDEFDCRKCASCCKLYKIRVENDDIFAIAQYLGQTKDEIIDRYLLLDNEETGVYIMEAKPCGFLNSDGKCRIYSVRPLVCRDFPHSRKPGRLYNLKSVMDFAEDCPALFEIIERLKVVYGFDARDVNAASDPFSRADRGS